MDAPRKIGPFRIYEKHRTTMQYGTHYHAVLRVPFSFRKRGIRVWVPEDYEFDGDKRHPVIYMADGQNLVDKFLTRYGDWHLDRVVEKIRKKGLPTPILVGVDSPHSSRKRTLELNPPERPDNLPAGQFSDSGLADVFVNYIADKLKPLIDSLFLTRPEKEATAIGGSSMGGIMAFYGYLARPDAFGFSLSFSTPFFFYKDDTIRKQIAYFDPNPDRNGLLALYVGGRDFEAMFTPGNIMVAELLRTQYGYDDKSLFFAMDREQIHHEDAWSRYAKPALEFWLKTLK